MNNRSKLMNHLILIRLCWLLAAAAMFDACAEEPAGPYGPFARRYPVGDTMRQSARTPSHGEAHDRMAFDPSYQPAPLDLSGYSAASIICGSLTIDGVYWIREWRSPNSEPTTLLQQSQPMVLRGEYAVTQCGPREPGTSKDSLAIICFGAETGDTVVAVIDSSGRRFASLTVRWYHHQSSTYASSLELLQLHLVNVPFRRLGDGSISARIDSADLREHLTEVNYRKEENQISGVPPGLLVTRSYQHQSTATVAGSGSLEIRLKR